MAGWKNAQTFTILVPMGQFYAHEDGTEGQLSIGDTDKELYILVQFPPDEHGVKSRPVSLQLKNWNRMWVNGDHIGAMVEKATSSRAAIRQLEAEKTASAADFKDLNDSRTKYPDIFTDEVYGKKAEAIKAKYPLAHPVKAGGKALEGATK